MNIEVGMYYARSGKGNIHICKEGNFTPDEYVERNKGIYDVKKASHNIIDLIEVGDYVNGHLIHCIQIKNDGTKMLCFNSSNYVKNIKEILTKEQYEANVYKIGE